MDEVRAPVCLSCVPLIIICSVFVTIFCLMIDIKCSACVGLLRVYLRVYELLNSVQHEETVEFL